MASEDIIATATATTEAIEAALKWIESPGVDQIVGRERSSIIRGLQQTRTRAKRLSASAARPMSVGVFGPSQAGKSYLVEVLARPEAGPLRARFDNMEPIDFLSEINPIGEKESTGLVTRFTTRPAKDKAPEGFPVRLSLLSELDIVKILGNTFFLDGDQTKERRFEPEEMSEVLGRLSGPAAAGAATLSEEDIFDLHDYFDRNLAGSRSMDSLGGYWDELRNRLPQAPLADRALLMSFLWGRHEPFTRLYEALARALDSLKGASELFAPIASLIPRDGSILDVSALAGLSNAKGDDIKVRTPAGVEASLPRPILAALTAELRIELADTPRPFFQHTDLLDFPGARSRQKLHLASFFEGNHEALKETFLRGKVAYLFDRYVAEQELTSMLLCVRPSNQEVATLPDLVNEWIEASHGRTPDARKSQPTLLFLVLTWFDSHFVDKAGDVANPAARFRARLEASLLGFFGKAHAWPRNWAPARPFNNCFWFRNPNYPAESIIRYDGRRELAFLPDKEDRIQELRSGFLSLPEASAHFKEPERAFDEALRLNDGGVSYLAANLELVCRPELKQAQIAERLNDIRRQALHILDKYYVDVDIEARLNQRRQQADALFDGLETVVAEGRFGSFLSSFLLDPADVSDVVYSALRSARAAEAGSTADPKAVTIRPQRALTGFMRPKPGASQAAAPAADSSRAPSTAVDREHSLALACLDAWSRKLFRLVDDPEIHRRFQIDPDMLRDLVQEKLSLARRIKIAESIREDLRHQLPVESAEASSPKVALIACARINRLVGDLGFGQLPPPERPKVDDGAASRPVFNDRPIANDARGIQAEPRNFAAQYATDWFFGYLRVIEDNVLKMADLQIDVEINSRLGEILQRLGSEPACGAGSAR